MKTLIKGSLVEYKQDMQKTILSEVIFQFNPETLTRTIQIPSASGSGTAAPTPGRAGAGTTSAPSRETRQVGEVPSERISFSIQLDAMDQLNENNQLAREYGIGPQLSALQKMATPHRRASNQNSSSVDAVADSASPTGSGSATTPSPREQYRNILFRWGEKRVLPVMIDSLSITEKQFDAQLNPVLAEVSLSLSVITVNPYTEDDVARGADDYTNRSREQQAEENETLQTQVQGASGSTGTAASEVVNF